MGTVLTYNSKAKMTRNFLFIFSLSVILTLRLGSRSCRYRFRPIAEYQKPFETHGSNPTSPKLYRPSSTIRDFLPPLLRLRSDSSDIYYS